MTNSNRIERGKGHRERPVNRLTALARTIQTEVEAAETAFQSAVQHAIRAGELLIEAKSLCGHGEWMPWVRENFPGSQATANNYMKLARNSHRVGNLPTVREAIALLAPANVGDRSPEARSLPQHVIDEDRRLEEEYIAALEVRIALLTAQSGSPSTHKEG